MGGTYYEESGSKMNNIQSWWNAFWILNKVPYPE